MSLKLPFPHNPEEMKPVMQDGRLIAMVKTNSKAGQIILRSLTGNQSDIRIRAEQNGWFPVALGLAEAIAKRG